MRRAEEGRQFCPYCNREIVAANLNAVLLGEERGFLFVHDDVEHPQLQQEDFEAMQNGVQ